MALKVSDVARRTGITPDTVRFYEKEGLLPPPQRSAAGYRQYDDTIPQRIGFIRSAQDLGLRLREIRELLDIQDRGACPCGHTKELVTARLEEIDAEMERLAKLRTELGRLADLECAATDESELWNCEVMFVPRPEGGER